MEEFEFEFQIFQSRQFAPQASTTPFLKNENIDKNKTETHRFSLQVVQMSLDTSDNQPCILDDIINAIESFSSCDMSELLEIHHVTSPCSGESKSAAVDQNYMSRPQRSL